MASSMTFFIAADGGELGEQLAASLPFFGVGVVDGLAEVADKQLRHPDPPGVHDLSDAGSLTVVRDRTTR